MAVNRISAASLVRAKSTMASQAILTFRPIQYVENEGPGAVSNHRHRAGRIADLAGKELARKRPVLFGDDVVVGRGLGHDAGQHRVALPLPADPPQQLRESHVDEQ